MRLDEIKKTKFDLIKIKNLNDAQSIIYDNCSQIISIYSKTHKFLYRGISLSNTDIFIAETYKTEYRWSKDIDKKLDSFLKVTGFAALRENSMFCTSNLIHAKKFTKPNGKIYKVFPFNDFKFTWSPKIFDLNKTFDFLPDVKDYNSKTKIFYNDLFKKLTPQQFISKYKFKSDLIDEALQKGNEILIKGRYLAIAI